MRVIPISYSDGPKYEEFSIMLSRARAEYVKSQFRFVTSNSEASNTGTFNRWLHCNHGLTFDYNVGAGITAINVIDEQQYLMFLLKYANE